MLEKNPAVRSDPDRNSSRDSDSGEDSHGESKKKVADSATQALRRANEHIRKLVAARDGTESASATTPDDRLLFPGEVGDSFSESLVVLSFPGITVDSKIWADVAKKYEKAAMESARMLLKTEEELVRGVATLDHRECVERIVRGGSVLSSGQASLDCGSLRVGVLLPMSLPRAISIRDNLRTAVAVAVGREGVAAEVAGCKTWAFSKHTGIEGLRKWLRERSLEDLRKMIKTDVERKEWVGVDSAEIKDHDALCKDMAAAFVLTELRSDLLAALESGASDAQVESLLRGWDVPDPRGASRADRINQAVAALNSERRWGEVEGWVRLHRGRIQGRTRLGLGQLMEREADKIEQYGLTAAEVLGLYLYTGPEFVPMNGICRSFPQSILTLLEGDGMTAANRLCTTLFCISSALKKLSQTTSLPDSRCAVLRSHHFPASWHQSLMLFSPHRGIGSEGFRAPARKTGRETGENSRIEGERDGRRHEA